MAVIQDTFRRYPPRGAPGTVVRDRQCITDRNVEDVRPGYAVLDAGFFVGVKTNRDSALLSGWIMVEPENQVEMGEPVTINKETGQLGSVESENHRKVDGAYWVRGVDDGLAEAMIPISRRPR